MKKKTSKEILFERFEKVDPTFKRRIDENDQYESPFLKKIKSLINDYFGQDANVKMEEEANGEFLSFNVPENYVNEFSGENIKNNPLISKIIKILKNEGFDYSVLPIRTDYGNLVQIRLIYPHDTNDDIDYNDYTTEPELPSQYEPRTSFEENKKGLKEESVGEKAHKNLRRGSSEIYQKVKNIANSLDKELYNIIYNKLDENGITPEIGDNAFMDAFNIIIDSVNDELIDSMSGKYGGLSPDSDEVDKDSWIY